MGLLSRASTRSAPSFDRTGEALKERIEKLKFKKSTPYTALGLIKASGAFETGICLSLNDGFYNSYTSVGMGIGKVSILREKIWSAEKTGEKYFASGNEIKPDLKNCPEGLEYWIFPLDFSRPGEPWEAIMIAGISGDSFPPARIHDIVSVAANKLYLKPEQKTPLSETVLNETPFDETTPDEIPLGETALDKIALDETDAISPDETTLDEIPFDEPVFNEIAPDETAPNEIAFNKMTPDEIASNETTLDEIPFDETAFNEVIPDEIAPDENVPEKYTDGDLIFREADIDEPENKQELSPLGRDTPAGKEFLEEELNRFDENGSGFNCVVYRNDKDDFLGTLSVLIGKIGSVLPFGNDYTIVLLPKIADRELIACRISAYLKTAPVLSFEASGVTDALNLIISPP